MQSRILRPAAGIARVGTIVCALMLGWYGPALASNPVPTFTKAFSPETIALNESSTLTFTIDNSAGAEAMVAYAFSDTMPEGIEVVGAGSDSCGGAIEISTSEFTYNGQSIDAGTSCEISVEVAGVAAGAHENISSTLDYLNGGIDALPGEQILVEGSLPEATATLTVEATPTPPLFSKSFAPSTIVFDEASMLTYTIDNTANPDQATSLAFQDLLPQGLFPVPLVGADSSCAGNLLISISSIELSEGTVGAGQTCTIAVPMMAEPGWYDTVSGDLTSSLGNSGPAQATLSVTFPPRPPPLKFFKSFKPDVILLNESSTLTFTIDNSAGQFPMLGYSFSDSMPEGIEYVGEILDTCGGAIGEAGASGFSYLGESIDGGTFCEISVEVRGVAVGQHVNISSTLDYLDGAFADLPGEQTPSEVSLPAATAALNVSPPPPLVFSKAFEPSTIEMGETSTLTFTIENTTGDLTATAISFMDFMAGLTIVDAPGTNTCGGTATPGELDFSYEGGALGPSATCTISIMVTSSLPGPHFNSAFLQSSLGFAGPAEATLMVNLPPPPLVFSKAFEPSTIEMGGTSTLTFTIDNITDDLAATAISFVDIMPKGVTVLDAPGTDTCGGTATPTEIDLTYEGGALGAGAACTISIMVTSSIPGEHFNRVMLDSSLGFAGTAQATLTVNLPPPPLVFSKAFEPSIIAPGETSTLTVTIDNSAGAVYAKSLAFDDKMPDGLVIGPEFENSCQGQVGLTQSPPDLALEDGGVGPGETCTITVAVTTDTPGQYDNTSGQLTSNLGFNKPATATLYVLGPQEGPPLFAKSFSPESILVGETSTLTFTIDNSHNTLAAVSMAFDDVLPDGLLVDDQGLIGNDCGGEMSVAQDFTSVDLSEGTVDAGATCTITVPVTSDVGGQYDNTTSVLSTALGEGDKASATLYVDQPKDTPPSDPEQTENQISNFLTQRGNTIAGNGANLPDRLTDRNGQPPPMEPLAFAARFNPSNFRVSAAGSIGGIRSAIDAAHMAATGIRKTGDAPSIEDMVLAYAGGHAGHGAASAEQKSRFDVWFEATFAHVDSDPRESNTGSRISARTTSSTMRWWSASWPRSTGPRNPMPARAARLRGWGGWSAPMSSPACTKT